jgi:hypothetical protein
MSGVVTGMEITAAIVRRILQNPTAAPAAWTVAVAGESMRGAAVCRAASTMRPATASAT